MWDEDVQATLADLTARSIAERCLDRKPGNLPAVTGASRETLLGGVYYALDESSGKA